MSFVVIFPASKRTHAHPHKQTKTYTIATRGRPSSVHSGPVVRHLAAADGAHVVPVRLGECRTSEPDATSATCAHKDRLNAVPTQTPESRVAQFVEKCCVSIHLYRVYFTQIVLYVTLRG